MRLTSKTLSASVLVIIFVISVIWLSNQLKKMTKKPMKSYSMNVIYRLIHTSNKNAKSITLSNSMKQMEKDGLMKLTVRPYYQEDFQCHDIELRRRVLTVSNFSCEGILFDNLTYRKT